MLKLTKRTSNFVVAKKTTGRIPDVLKFFIGALTFCIVSNVEAKEIFNKATCNIFKF